MIPFPFNENRFFFFVADHLLVGQCVQISWAIGAFSHVWKWHNVQRERSEMRRCTTHDLYRSKLWKQDHCHHPQNAHLDGSTYPGWWKQIFWLPLWSMVWFQVRATSCQLTSSKSAWKSTPKCTWICWRVWWSPGAIRWPVADTGNGRKLSAGPQVQRDPGLASEGVLRLYTLISLAPSSLELNPLDYFVWSYVKNFTNMTSHNTKASLITVIRRVFAELPPALVEKACSQFRIRIEAVIEAESGYIE